MSQLRIIFRTDASHVIGTGHFMRCLTLAGQMQSVGARIFFVTRELPLYLQQMLKERDVGLFSLPKLDEVKITDELPHSVWLGTSQTHDAEQTIALLGSDQWDWLVVDHYALDHRFESQMRKVVKHVLAIDDLADRKHDCDILLDQNFYNNKQQRYIGKVPQDCKLLLGPRYALLRPEFAAIREQRQVRTGSVQNILVFFGGMDADNLTGQVLNLLIDLNLDLHVNVVIGQQHQQKKNIEQLCVQHNFICHIQTDQMASLMGSADLAIGAGGASNWERCCMGLPTIVVSTAANQISISSELSKFGGCVYVGSAGSNTLEKIQKALLSFINSPKDIENCSRIGLDLVDGDGASRVCKKLINQMRVEVLISNKDHPVTRHVRNWALNQRNIHIVHSTKDLQGGHILFLVSCNEILQTDTIKKFKHTLILHASDLPEGRGWSPHIWSVLEGKKTITLSLLEADTKVDQGSIWLKENIELEGHELFDEINEKLFEAELALMTKAIQTAHLIIPQAQANKASTYYPKRTPEDSRLDIKKNLIDQFNLLRVADKNRFPAFFEHLGHKYIVRIEKVGHES